MNRDSKLLVRYYRLSLEDEGTKESESIANQRRLIEDYVKKHEDLQEMESLELSDDGYTGTNFKRPGIKRFLELLRKNKVGCLIVKDFSRFSRDYIEMGNYVEQIFPFMEVRFISVNDGYDSLHSGMDYNIEIPFKGILNDLYSKDISMKAKAAKRQMTKHGQLCSGSYPFGYKKAEAAQRKAGAPLYTIDEEAAQTVRYIFKMALEGKKNIQIARVLNQERYLTPGMYKRANGGFGYGLKEGEQSIWDSTKVLLILRDERYKGTLVLGRYQSAGIGTGKLVKVPEEQWFRKENGMPAIITEEDFAQVQAMRPVQKRGKYRKEHHILYRKVRCGCCGHYLYYKPSEFGEQYHRFFCKQSHLNPESKCFRGYIKEKEILDMLLILLHNQAEMAETLKQKAQKIPRDFREYERRRKHLEKEVEQWKAAKGQAYLEYREGLCTKEAFLARKTALQTEILKNEEELASLKKQIEITEPSVNEAIECLEGCNRIEKLDRGLLEKLIDTVWVYDGERVKVDFTFKDLYSLS